MDPKSSFRGVSSDQLQLEASADQALVVDGRREGLLIGTLLRSGTWRLVGTPSRFHRPCATLALEMPRYRVLIRRRDLASVHPGASPAHSWPEHLFEGTDPK